MKLLRTGAMSAICATMAVLLIACSHAAGRAQEDSDTDAAVSGEWRQVQGDSLAALIAALRNIRARYVVTESGAWEFVGPREMFNSIREFRDAAVERLVLCLDRTDLTQTQVDGRTVPLGVLCYEALSETAYHEAVAADGDIDGEWPGYILPTASPDELRAARHAWEEVVRARSYILYP